MEQGPSETPLAFPTYRIKWHQEIKDDLLQINPSTVKGIIEGSEYRLSRAPQFLGQPLKGTTNLLWRICFSKYRIIYTINVAAKEVWVLSVQKRDMVYRNSHVQSLFNLAFAIQKQIEQNAPGPKQKKE